MSQQAWPPLMSEGSEKPGNPLGFPFSLAQSILFIISFFIPLGGALYLTGAFNGAAIVRPSQDEIFPESIAVGSGDQHIQIAATPALEPSSKADFLMVSWFKPRELPRRSERMLLLSKGAGGDRQKSGFSLLLFGEDRAVRPVVFWGDARGGSWFKFTEVAVAPRSWLMFALSLRKGHLLGLHVAEVTELGKAKIQLLGGYEIGEGGYSGNFDPLLLAPPGTDRFVGRVGPFGIFHRKNLSEDLNVLLKKFAREPLDVLSEFSKSEVGLWWPGSSKDQGPSEPSVVVVGGAKARKG